MLLDSHYRFNNITEYLDSGVKSIALNEIELQIIEENFKQENI